MEWYAYVGFVAAGCLSIFLLPPFFVLLKKKDSTKINLLMYIIYIIGCFFFLLGAILTWINKGASQGAPTTVAQSICLIIASTTIGIKISNMKKAKKQNISESEYCKLKIEKATKKEC